MAEHPELREGQDGDWVVYLQQMLNYHGESVPEDGNFGPAVTAAVQRFQQARRLDGDGVVNAATWAALTGTQHEQESHEQQGHEQTHEQQGHQQQGHGQQQHGQAHGEHEGHEHEGQEIDPANKVPDEVAAATGLPKDYSKWDDHSKEAYFKGQEEVEITGVESEEVQVASIEHGTHESEGEDGGHVA